MAMCAAVDPGAPGGDGPNGDRQPADLAQAVARLERIAARLSANVAHMVMISMGMSFLMCSISVAATLQYNGQLWSSLSDVWMAVAILAHIIGNLFVDLPPLDEVHLLTVAMWVCGFLGTLLMFTVALGRAAARRPSAARAAGYSLLAAILLAWLVDIGNVLFIVSSWGSFDAAAAETGAGHSQEFSKVQRAAFEDAHKLLTGSYDEQRCSVARRAAGGAPSQISCEPGSEEALARMLEVYMMADFCQPGDDARARQVEGCLAHARELGLVPGEPSDGDTIYCQCWCEYFGFWRNILFGYAILWCALLHGVLRVLEAAADPWISRMCDVRRREFRTFVFNCTWILMYSAASEATSAG